jgi:hypothetical protein
VSFYVSTATFFLLQIFILWELSSRYVFSWYPFYFDFHSARIIFDVSSGFYLWNINNTKADICNKWTLTIDRPENLLAYGLHPNQFDINAPLSTSGKIGILFPHQWTFVSLIIGMLGCLFAQNNALYIFPLYPKA